jgi:hypothetical protein
MIGAASGLRKTKRAMLLANAARAAESECSASVSLDNSVGRRVTVTGVALHSPASDVPVLAVSSASVCD